MSVKEKLRVIVGLLARSWQGAPGSAVGPLPGLFRPEERDEASVARNCAAAFVMALAGGDTGPAFRYLEETGMPAAQFLKDGIGMVVREAEERYREDEGFRQDFDALYGFAAAPGSGPESPEAAGLVAAVFFPEGLMPGGILPSLSRLRARRSVRITAANPRPIASPAREVLFTSNILLTVPAPGRFRDIDLPDGLNEALARAAAGAQEYWYDHPIPVGAPPEENEALHGLKGFSEALAFEARAGAMAAGEGVDFVCSLSVTHRGLGGPAREWLGSELARSGALRGINLHLITESDCRRLLDEVILPAAGRWCPGRNASMLGRVFGVDGEYGRHYSFLKAIARFWQVFVSPETRATFKIDLDQVFPQEELVRETGATAFGHLGTPLWGARGTDHRGRDVYLGMIAGALVNRKEIASSLFTPDVPIPQTDAAGDEILFRSQVPQAVSTLAEMGRTDGAGARQRVHVTGGTTGILVEALKEYRPFTLSMAGRAEDQAYLLSVLFDEGERGLLRYAHVPGLVMRHDAELFAAAAGAARTGKVLGDYVRTLLFTGYANALPWPERDIKQEIDPFTGCFVSRLPVTVVLLRFAFKAAMLFASGETDEGRRLFIEGSARLPGAIRSYILDRDFLRAAHREERAAWDIYYDALDGVERGLAAGDPYACGLREAARACVASARVRG